MGPVALLFRDTYSSIEGSALSVYVDNAEGPSVSLKPFGTESCAAGGGRASCPIPPYLGVLEPTLMTVQQHQSPWA